MGTSEIAFCSVFALLLYIVSSATPDPNVLDNILSTLYKQAAKSNKALVLVMDRNKNLNAQEKYVDQSSHEIQNDNQNRGNGNRPNTYQQKPVFQYKVVNQDQGNDYRPDQHKHYHQHNSNHKVSYEYGYNPQNQKEHNHGYYSHLEPKNGQLSYVSSYERPYHQFSSYETLHEQHSLRSPKIKKQFNGINREAIIVESLRHLLRDSLQRSKGKAHSRNQNTPKIIASSSDGDDVKDDHHHRHEHYPPQYYYDKHGKLHAHDETNQRINDNLHQHSHEDLHQHNHDNAHQHSNDEAHQRSLNNPHQRSHDEPHQHSHDEPRQDIHDDSHKHSRDNLHKHSHENVHQNVYDHNRDDAHEHKHSDVHEHNHYDNYNRGYHHHHDPALLRQKDRNKAPVTTPTSIPKPDKLDPHSNDFHMKKSFKVLRTAISCKSQILCKKECLGNTACESECEQVFVCNDNIDKNKIERPEYKSNRGGCDDCNDDMDNCPEECPKKEEDGCNDCEQEEEDNCDDGVSTRGYEEEQVD